ncbi:hypothetical protein [Longimicrobium sp.]|uniref:hypothetical protein n=1 Tax=Longimicrobium sp. TaxID=2029185 RepID=UPI003B3B96EF
MRAPERTLLALAALLLSAAPAAAQAAPARPAAAGAPPAAPAEASLPEAEVYRREVFQYPGAGGRPDPFSPLLSGEEMGVRVQDLKLVSVIFSGTPGASVATFTLPDSTQRVRLRVGQRLGSVTVVRIQPRRVDVREDEMGVSRVYSLELERPRRGVTTGQPAPAPAVAPPPAAAPATPAAGGRP